MTSKKCKCDVTPEQHREVILQFFVDRYDLFLIADRVGLSFEQAAKVTTTHGPHTETNQALKTYSFVVQKNRFGASVVQGRILTSSTRGTSTTDSD